MNKKVILLPLLFLFCKIVNAQHIKVDNSLLVTSYTNSKDLPILYDKLRTYSIYLGADYLDKEWFYLSSQLGYVKIGGREKYHYIDTSGIEESSYIHLNTTFRIYKDNSGLRSFVGIGPYLNVLAGSNKFKTPVYNEFYGKKTYLGARGEAGFTCDINKIRLGLMVNYMLSLTPTASSSALNLRNNNLGGSISLGYLISK